MAWQEPDDMVKSVDKAAGLSPPTARMWDVKDYRKVRFGWDQNYVKRHGQEFSPWRFATNCSAVLGCVQEKGHSVIMAEMAEYIFEVASAHIEAIGSFRYVSNNFRYGYLWHEMKPPFYGAFMNSVTAYGLLQLYEATRAERFLLLADKLLATSIDLNAPVPLCSDIDGDFWLHEYVFKSPGGPVHLKRAGEWHLARIYNGHIQAIFGLMRIRSMTGVSDYDNAIERATSTMARWLPKQAFDGRYFSYSPDLPIYPDYGQSRAPTIAEALAIVTGHASIKATASEMRRLFDDRILGQESKFMEPAKNEAKLFAERASQQLV